MDSDILIVGGGLIGLSLARELHRRGMSAAVFDGGRAGAASWAGAGMLAGRMTTHPALRPWTIASAELYPEWVAELERETYLSVGYRRCGTLVFGAPPDPLPTGWELVEPTALARIELALDPSPLTTPAWRIADDHCVDNRALHAALRASVQARRIPIVSAMVVAVRRQGTGFAVTDHRGSVHSATAVVNAAGAWAGEIEAPVSAPVRPRKGQMLCLRTAAKLYHVLEAPGVYIVPRGDGRVLIGATLEDVGFDGSVDLLTLETLRQRAIALIPALASAERIESWAGYRPCSSDELPMLGESSCPGYWFATAHYRDGILLAPITARVLAAAIAGEPAPVELSAFAPQRFSQTPDIQVSGTCIYSGCKHH